MLILNAYYCHASAVQVEGNTTFPCNDGLGECLIIEDEWNPYERRKLYNFKLQSQNRNKPVIPCPKNAYGGCIKADCLKRNSYDRCRLQKS
ncbi:hypothetical protein SO802_007763 [Lithocarpus litseifolius]|uniref:Uncharacterized protein n=1 Tax=Lithocarpus litseifolius TaxID=425828 RepID=A0AAW2DTR4_9ROSI